jgi:hypothetical protein
MNGLNPNGVIMILSALLAIASCDGCVMTAKGPDALSTKEIKLLDGTRATCVYSSNGLFCIRHIEDEYEPPTMLEDNGGK